MQARSLIDVCRTTAEYRGDSRGFTFLLENGTEGGSLSFGQLDRRARAIAACLQQYGVRDQQVLLLLPPGLDYIASVFACFYSRSVAVPCYLPRNKASFARLSQIALDSGAQWALTTRASYDSLQRSPHLTPVLKLLHWQVVDSIEDEMCIGWRDPGCERKDPAIVQYTSGSTGNPKGVVLTHGNLLHNSEWIRRLFAATTETRLISWLPCYHDMGLIGSVIQPVYTGLWAIHMSPATFIVRPIRWLQAISDYRATVSGGPNFAFELCVERTTPEQRAALDLSSWDLAYCGAEPIRPKTLRRFSEAFASSGFQWSAWFPCYGLAEATLMVTGGEKSSGPIIRGFAAEKLSIGRAEEVSDSDHQTRELVGCGTSLGDQELLVVNPETSRRCQPGEIGEIWISGPSVAHGYWNRPEESCGVFAAWEAGGDLFLRTGDLGFLHEGQLYVTGRIKDVIVIAGRKHSPHDLEVTAAGCHSSLQHLGNVAFSVELEGSERVVLLQEVDRRLPQEERYRLVTAIRGAISEQHNIQAYAVKLVMAGTLPRTSSGKLMRHKSRANYCENTLQYLDGPTETRNTSIPTQEVVYDHS